MARRSHSQTLALWANGERVGRWTSPARGDMELQYDPAWRVSATGRPLSLSLPTKVIADNLTLAVAIAIVTLWNFFANRYWTYGDIQ